ncbi:hypothetical protein [Brevundimonas sp.]|uniref:hypothetical protein n=2 Tax=Brevundimonas sp. TaxID=1871086 RepID=UPI0028A25D33|nr:hypothetical protein [Brevundimonas sp.]
MTVKDDRFEGPAMIEESFVRLYAHDFIQMAVKSELGQDVDAALQRRLAEARSHAALMDARKGSAHLTALIERIRDEAPRFDGRAMLRGADPSMAAKRRHRFLKVADALVRPMTKPSSSLRAISASTRNR